MTTFAKYNFKYKLIVLRIIVINCTHGFTIFPDKFVKVQPCSWYVSDLENATVKNYQ